MLESKMKWTFAKKQNNIPNWNSNRFSPLIKELLLQRGITSDEEAEVFLSPDLTHLNSGKLLTDIDKAAERVHKGIAANEKILVYGDYDADGVSSTAIMIKALQELGADCDYYIPNRFTEGYGPNEEAFRKAYENGYHLIITVDTGIASIHEAAFAEQLGIDLIITDHHEPQEQLPDAYAIIHPKCSPDYKFKELAGAGVAFKFAESLLGYFPKQYLDFLVIGTIADLVPLIDENRVLAHYGLKALSATSKPGLNALKRLCGIKEKVNEEDIGFSIGPRLNAVGRLQDADLAVQLLLTNDQDEAERIAEMVQSINQERQMIVSDIVEEAEDMVQADEQDVIIVAKEGWNQGVLGIVASNLARKYDRPAIVLSVLPEEGIMKGSARSIPAFDMFSNCMKIRDIFTHFGGHAQAAGMTLPSDNLQTLKAELNDMIQQQLTEEDFTQEIEITKTLALPEINEELVEEISQLAPFGMANPKPVFCVEDVPADIRQIGSNKKHLKMQFRDQNRALDGIGFGFGNVYDHLSPNTPIFLVGELSINEWNGFRNVQIVMQDMKIKEKQLFDHRGKKQFNPAPFVRRQHADHLAVKKSVPDESPFPDNVQCVTYDTNIKQLTKIHTLFLYDLPTDLEKLQLLLQHLNPVNIHVCFRLEDSAFMKVFPSREDFKWLYALLAKRNQIDIDKELSMILEAKGWTKDRVWFMANVFFDLGFVKIENGVIQLNTNPVKKDLTESAIYQERLNRAEIEKTLYYSTYDELKSWLSGCMKDRYTPEEELVYGL